MPMGINSSRLPNMSLWKLTVTWCLCSCLMGEVGCGSSKLLVMLIDGFRWDYIPTQQANHPSGFSAFISRGVKAEYMIPAFPSISLPNYFTIMTGLTPEHHGMVNNIVYDPDHDIQYSSYKDEGTIKSMWLKGVEPIWMTAKKQGLRSHLYYMMMCDGDYLGKKYSSCNNSHKFPNITGFTNALLDVTELFRMNKSDLAVVYFGNIDHLGHIYGPKSDEVNKEIKHLDGALQRLENVLQAKEYVDKHTKLSELVNVMILSDHGMVALSEKQFVNLTQYLDMEDVEHTTAGTVVYGIWPKAGKVEKVYGDLSNKPHMNVYRKEDLPVRWHYGGHKHTPVITVVAEIGYQLLSPDDPSFSRYNETGGAVKAGDHGYDNDEQDVRAIFVAAGPYFKKRKVIPPIESRDVYQVMCSVLGLHIPQNDGDWERVMPMLSNTRSTQTYTDGIPAVSFRVVIFTGCIGLLAVTVVCLGVSLLSCLRRKAHSRYKKIPNLDQMDAQFEL